MKKIAVPTTVLDLVDRLSNEVNKLHPAVIASGNAYFKVIEEHKQVLLRAMEVMEQEPQIKPQIEKVIDGDEGEPYTAIAEEIKEAGDALFKLIKEIRDLHTLLCGEIGRGYRLDE